MSALRKLITLSMPEAEGRLSRAAASVEKRETKLAELRERLAALVAADKRGEDEDNVLQLIVLKREIAQTQEELTAYREVKSRAQKAKDDAVNEAAAVAKAAHVEGLRARLKTLRPEIERQLEKFVELAGESESIRSRLVDFGVRETALAEYVEEVNRRTSTKSGGRERDTIPLKTLLLIPIVQ